MTLMPDAWEEFTLAVDCAKNGCEKPHSDDGDHTRTWDRIEDVPDTINGHAATLLTRTVTVTDWQPKSDIPGPADEQRIPAMACNTCGGSLVDPKNPYAQPAPPPTCAKCRWNSWDGC